MSDLWDRCREELQRCIRADDWNRSIAPLRAWMDAGTLYLWVERAADDWRAVANPARDFDAPIRAIAREVWGRKLRAIRYLDRPPSREHVLNERRIPEHRATQRERADRTDSRLWAYAKQEWDRLRADPGLVRLIGTEDEIRCKLDAIVMDRAKRRLAQDSPRVGGILRDRQPPENPPPPRERR